MKAKKKSIMKSRKKSVRRYKKSHKITVRRKRKRTRRGDRKRWTKKLRRTDGTNKNMKGGANVGDKVGGCTLIKMVGEGGYATVWTAKLDEDIFAVKIFNDPEGDVASVDAPAMTAEEWEAEKREHAEMVDGEIDALTALKDISGVVHMHSSSRPGETPKYIVMEYFSGNELFEPVAFGTLDETSAVDIIIKILKTLSEVHEKGWVHLDLKLENILYDPVTGEVKIIDFGFAKNCTAPGCPVDQVKGTAHYVAPEIIITNENYDGKKVDIYAVGITLYVMIYGGYPSRCGDYKGGVAPKHRKDKSLVALFRKDIIFPANKKGPVKDLIQSLTMKNPGARPTAAEALTGAMENPALARCVQVAADRMATKAELEQQAAAELERQAAAELERQAEADLEQQAAAELERLAAAELERQATEWDATKAAARANPRWVSDEEAERCMLCKPDWKFRSVPGWKRHHCRSCGWVVCADCLRKTVEMDRWVSSTAGHELKEAKDVMVARSDKYPTKAKRVCNSCAEHAPAEVAARLRMAEVAEREAAAPEDS